MLPLKFDDITEDDIVALVTNKVGEQRTIEYKEALPEGSDAAKKEFLADVCSFANLSGGDIIYGIREERDLNGRPTGTPGQIIGLSVSNSAAECTRLEALVRDGISPRIPIVFLKTLDISGSGPVICLRIARSWLKPHMVTLRGSSRFFSRTSAGKYQLNVQEIGRVFAEQRSLGEELRSWRMERLGTLLSGEGPIESDKSRKLVFHFVPAAALSGFQNAIYMPDGIRNLLRPISFSNRATWRYNADGFLVRSDDQDGRCISYVQVFRNGCLEYCDAHILDAYRTHGEKYQEQIPSIYFEQKVVEACSNAILATTRLGIDDPIYFSCSLIDVKGMTLSRQTLDLIADRAFDRPIIQTPEVELDRAEGPPFRNGALPIVNSVWQANGYEKTPFENDICRWDPFIDRTW
jgi:hypothetical protein